MARPADLDLSASGVGARRGEGPWGQAARSRLALLDDIRAAARAGQFRPYAQPIVGLQGPAPQLVAAESLLRWQHPQRGLLAAGEFLHLVEAAELLPEVDLATAGHLAAEVSVLDRAGRRVGRLWLNITVSELFDDAFVAGVASVAERAGLGAGRIGVEVPEVVLSINEAPLRHRLEDLRERGVAVAIDHCGSALRLLRLDVVPFDVVKLDRLLVDRVHREPLARRVVSALVELGHHEGAAVIAEGVEHQDQLQALGELGCDGAQGYLLGGPQPLTTLAGRENLALPTCTFWG